MNTATLEPVLRAALGERVRCDADSLAMYGRDWTRNFPVAPAAVVLPESTEEVVRLVQLARAHGFGIVPSGGRTGLSGGAVAPNGEVVLSLARMNKVLSFDPADRLVRCQAGLVTGELQAYAASQGLFYPVDFASSGSSCIGGNIATNAGGIKVIRYGLTRDWVAGLKVVTGAGEVLELNRGLVKNNTGYDFRHLFIGSEGTLGVIVEADIRLARTPPPQAVLVVGVPAFEDVLNVLAAFTGELDISAFEFFSELALQKVMARHGHARPFADPAAFYALIEVDEASSEQAMAVFERCVEQGWISDGVMSQSLTQAKTLWRLREDISESLSHETPFKNDISVRVGRIPQFLDEATRLIHRAYPEFEVVWFGHIGDGNLHLNILKPAALATDLFFERCGKVSLDLFAMIDRHGGSISAEHGVGMLKKPYLEYSRSAADIALMRGVKGLFDPDGVMNPGKLIDA
jgi:FAD/FMN-containing dehydrogenase